MADTFGTLTIDVVNIKNEHPIENAYISISYTGDPTNNIATTITNTFGRTDTITLEAPAEEFSQSPSEIQPFSQYTIIVNAKNYMPIGLSGVDIFPNINSILEVKLTPTQDVTSNENIVIPVNTLFGNFPSKIPEAEVKPISDSSEIVLSSVVVPEYIVVHDGTPADTTANNYYVRYRDYIKNVASCELYSTWPTETLKANILAIMSFTLNRVYTEFYRNQGYNFTITSSTAFDHKWVYGRNIFSNISNLVDELFASYLSRPNIKQPILTQYCDGKRVICPNWLSQWGSKYLGDENYSAIEILRYYYGNDMYINYANVVSGIPSSWPGYNLSVGERNDYVATIQEQLNYIRQFYNAIPYVSVDGIFGENTKNAVAKFQEIFGLNPTGIVDYPTWYKISDMYVRLSRIAELQ